MGKEEVPNFMVQSPYFITGYNGHVPTRKDIVGMSFAKGTHQLLLNPTWDSKQSVLSPIKTDEMPIEPLTAAKRVLKEEARLAKDQSIYRVGMTTGYMGCIPRSYSYSGMSFPKSSTLAVAQFEKQLRAENRARKELEMQVRVQSGDVPLYEVPACIQVPPMKIRYGPLQRAHAHPDKYVPRNVRRYGMSVYDMFPEDPDKYAVAGYLGHIPLYREMCGHTHKDLTHTALCEYALGRPFFKAPSTEKEDHFDYYDGNEMPVPVCPQPKEPTVLQREEWKARTMQPVVKPRIRFPLKIGLNPSYSGHVTGMTDMVGMTFGEASIRLGRKGCVNPLNPVVPDVNPRKMRRHRCIGKRVDIPVF